MRTMTELDLGWLVGLYEGEGCVGVQRRPSATYLTLVIKMTDEDVLKRAANITGLGHLTGPYIPKNPNHKTQWSWQVSTTEDVKELLALMWPLLGVRRQDQAKKAMEAQRYAIQRTPDERFWALVDKTDTCWLWSGSKGRAGHGTWTGAPGLSRVQAHRYAYSLHHEVVPPRLRNTCGHLHCVRPEHWERDVKYGMYTAWDGSDTLRFTKMQPPVPAPPRLDPLGHRYGTRLSPYQRDASTSW